MAKIIDRNTHTQNEHKQTGENMWWNGKYMGLSGVLNAHGVRNLVSAGTRV
jgi:hypothetical protein